MEHLNKLKQDRAHWFEIYDECPEEERAFVLEQLADVVIRIAEIEVEQLGQEY